MEVREASAHYFPQQDLACPPGYKQSEVGVIPEDWDVKLFGEIAQPRKERIDPRRTGPQEFCVELEHIEQGTGRLIGHTATSEGSSLKSVFQEHDVLFGKLRAYLRKYWLASRQGVCSTELWALVAKRSELIPSFLFQLVKVDRFIEVASSAYGTHMPRSDWNVVKNYQVRLPTPPEQEAIAEALSDADALSESLEQLLAKKRQLKQGAMQGLLTGKKRLPGFSVGWELKRLGEIISVLTDYTANGSFESLRNNVRYYESRNYAVLVRTTDLDKSVFYPERFTDKQGYEFLSKTALFGGEIVIANVGSIGKVFRVPFFEMPMTLAPNTYLLKFSASISEDFLYQKMMTQDFYSKLMSKIGSTTLQAINKDNLRDIELSIPRAIEEQTAIAAILSDMDAEIAALEEKLSKARNLKQGMMQELLTGRIRLV